jgi:hypothetical protein
VNFEKNKFEVSMSTNNGKLTDEEWTWLMKETVDIENFHIKSAVIIDSTLVITARGRPRNVLEQCCSFLLCFKLKTNEGLVVGVDPDYKYVKLDPLVYPEFNRQPFVQRLSDKSILLSVV